MQGTIGRACMHVRNRKYEQQMAQTKVLRDGFERCRSASSSSSSIASTCKLGARWERNRAAAFREAPVVRAVRRSRLTWALLLAALVTSACNCTPAKLLDNTWPRRCIRCYKLLHTPHVAASARHASQHAAEQRCAAHAKGELVRAGDC